MPVNWSWWEPTLWGHITHHSLITTMQFHTVANLMMLQPWDLHSVGKKRKRTKCILFFLPRGHHFKMSWCGCEFLSAFPLLLCLEANPLISCVSMDLQRTIFIWERERRKSTSFPFFVLDLYNHFKMAPVLLCFVHESWFESYVDLNEKRRFLFVFGQKPET